MTPHDLFTAYLKHRLVTDPKRHLPDGLPVSPDNESKYQDVAYKGTPDGDAWIGKYMLQDLEKRVTVPYGIWHSTQARCLCMIPSFRPDVELVDLLYRAGKWSVSPNDIALYNHLFWSLDGMSTMDLHNYQDSLSGLDAEILDDLLGDTQLEAILHKLGVHQVPPTYTDYLSRMMARGFQEFSTSTGAQAISWGNFTMKAIDKLQSVSEQNDVQKIIKELKIELTVPEMSHSLLDGEKLV